MSLISASRLAKSYGPHDIFTDVSLALPREAKVALVGPNGVGKTTLLRLLAGVEEPSAGAVQRARGLRLGYLPQESDLRGERTLWEEMLSAFTDLRAREADLARLESDMASDDSAARAAALERYGAAQEQFERDGGYTYDVRIRQVLGGLGFAEDDHGKPLNLLSGGQRTRGLLARLLLENPDVLLLDEPTNHLDLQAIEWLEGWLNAWPGACLIVSHDRYFMDQCVRTVWELGPPMEVYHGNYSAYLVQRQERRARQRAEFEAQKAFILKEQDYIRRNIAGQNTRQAKGRLRRLERLMRDPTARHPESDLLAAPKDDPTLRLKMTTGLRSGDRVLETRDMVVGHRDDGRVLFRVPDLLLQRGECAALIGPNGAGKTTFLRTLLGKIPPLEGEAKLGANVHVGYFAQAHEGLRPERSVLAEIQSAREMGEAQARHLLAQYLFTGDDLFKPVAALSGGERSRLALAKLALQGANLLLLDEPTNHLDISSQEILEDVLAEFPGTILLVSHDRYLIDALATHIWHIRPESESLRVFRGTYREYAATLQEEARPAPAKSTGKAARGGNGKKAESTEARRRAARAKELERDVAALEARLREITIDLEAAGADVDRVRELGQAYSNVETELTKKLEEWESLSEAS